MKKSAARKKTPKVVRNTKLNREQRGKSKVLLIAIVAVVLLGAGGFYFFSQQGGSIGALPVGKAALNPNCEQNDPELCKYLNNWANSRAYSVTSTSEMSGMSMESIMSMTSEGDTHMISKTNGKETSNMISIGDTTYTLDYSDNTWWKQTFTSEENEMEDEDDDTNDLSFDQEMLADTATYTFIAKEPCGSLTCFKYEFGMGDPGQKQFIWFDDKEYLTRKMTMEDPTGATYEAVYSYDNVTVKVPSPTKEGTPDMGAGMGEYSEAEVQQLMQQFQNQTDDSSSEGF